MKRRLSVNNVLKPTSNAGLLQTVNSLETRRLARSQQSRVALLQFRNLAIGKAGHLFAQHLQEDERPFAIVHMLLGRHLPGLLEADAPCRDLHSIAGEQSKGDMVNEVRRHGNAF